MNRRTFIVSGTMGLINAGCSVQIPIAPSGLLAVRERKMMLDFALPGLDGTIVRSADMSGNALILRFWATW
jgi:hypothetical protein